MKQTRVGNGAKSIECERGDRCTATKADGESCRAFAMRGTGICRAHTQAGNFGRKNLLDDPAVLEAIEKALSGGAYRKDAAAYAGIGTSTFYRWLEVGEAQAENDDQGHERIFREMVTRAEAVAKVRLSGLITSHAKDAGAPRRGCSSESTPTNTGGASASSSKGACTPPDRARRLI